MALCIGFEKLKFLFGRFLIVFTISIITNFSGLGGHLESSFLSVRLYYS